MGIRLGIDIGSATTSAAFIDPHGKKVLCPDLRNREEFFTPSIVHLNHEGAFIGMSAFNLLEDSPQLSLAPLNCHLIGQPDSVYCDADDRNWSHESLIAIVLRKLLEDVRAATQQPIDGGCIAVPGSLTEDQRLAIRDAGHLVGLENLDWVPAPIAAAYRPEVGSGKSSTLVVDLGASAARVAVVEANSGLWTLIESREDRDSGGAGFLSRLVAHLVELIELDLTAQPLSPLEDRQLSLMAEQILNAFASDSSRRHFDSALLIRGRVREFFALRSHFDGLAGEWVERVLRECDQLLSKTNRTWSDIQRVVVCGGFAIVPGIVSALRDATANTASFEADNPLARVTYGAASMSGHDVLPGNTSRRVAPATLGFQIRKHEDGGTDVEPFVERGTPLPAQTTATYYTNRDDQTRLVLDVVEKNGKEVNSLGLLEFPISNPRKNLPVEVTLGYNSHARVFVAARDTDTGIVTKHSLLRGGSHSAALFEQRERVTGIQLCR